MTFDAIVRKFTNYRNARKKRLAETTQSDKVSDAATFLMDMKSFSKGRDLFKEEKHAEITTRKTEILLSGEVTSPVGAYQRALRELWEEADREDWERRAETHGKNIYE
jgi:hypothetical protein